jgi:ankyrin repeat protein
VQALIKAKADVNLGNIHGETPLMYASKGGHTDTVQALIEAGAFLNSQAEVGSCALGSALVGVRKLRAATVR